MRILVYYCCLDVSQGQQAFIDASLKQLEDILAKSPLSLNYSFRQMPGDLKKKFASLVDDIINSNFIGSKLAIISNRFKETLDDELGEEPAFHRILVCSSKDTPLVKLCQKHAPWGVSCGCMTVVYELANKYAIWHETLHVLDADDCYKKGKDGQVIARGPTCKSNCIMVYDPSEETVNIKKWPFLCKENLSKIKKDFDDFSREWSVRMDKNK